MISYSVYLLASRSRVLYVGVTNDIQRRVWDHKTRRTPGFTTEYSVNRLVYLAETSDITAAIEREKEIKSWRREKKVTLIEGDNPKWEDLSADWFEEGKVVNDLDTGLRSAEP